MASWIFPACILLWALQPVRQSCHRPGRVVRIGTRFYPHHQGLGQLLSPTAQTQLSPETSLRHCDSTYKYSNDVWVPVSEWENDACCLKKMRHTWICDMPPLLAWPPPPLRIPLDSESSSERIVSDIWEHLILILGVYRTLTPLCSSWAKYTKLKPPSPKTLIMLTARYPLVVKVKYPCMNTDKFARLFWPWRTAGKYMKIEPITHLWPGL